jgi:tetrahydromethanopterin S-methyltransferase subunit A
MRQLGRLMPADEHGEQRLPVRLMRWSGVLQDWGTAGPVRRGLRKLAGRQAWPVTPGHFRVGTPTGPVAVCTLTSNEMIEPLAVLPGVAIAGRVYTVNLGIEKIILNVTANPSIRFLLLCGRDSPIFKPAQGLAALVRDGVTGERRIVGAEGHLPVLANLPRPLIEAFRQQVELVDLAGETDIDALATQVKALWERSSRVTADQSRTDGSILRPKGASAVQAQFKSIRPGGQRERFTGDAEGFFVITLDRAAGEIVVRHYLNDNTPAHEMRGRCGESMLLGLLREKLVSQPSHAGYLGAELAKAEAALRLGLEYEQDRPWKQASSL